jgi:indole-3-glycerol phosphate synthase
MSEDFLAAMAASSRTRCERARQLRPEPALRGFIARLPPAPRLRLSARRFDLIAELKLRSPATGTLASAASEDIAGRVLGYSRAGAAAVSVLTEPSRFDGSMLHLEKAARALAFAGCPAMRKDFLVDPYQVLEARAAGAGGVLVILRMLPPAGVRLLAETALEQGLFVLLEAFDERDIDHAQVLKQQLAGVADLSCSLLIGVNCRDLVSLQVVPQRLEALVDRLPTDVPRVAESGLVTPDDAARLAAAGYDLALVGGALMSGADPEALTAAMIVAGRGARD